MRVLIAFYEKKSRQIEFGDAIFQQSIQSCTVLIICLSVLFGGTLMACVQTDMNLQLLNQSHSPKAIAWADERTSSTISLMEKELVFGANLDSASEILSQSPQIPKFQVVGERIFAFIQDVDSPIGSWRGTDRASFFRGEANWETFIDFDDMENVEQRIWFLDSAQCLAKRCLITLSDRGKDAKEVREFDLETRAFVIDGFLVPEHGAFLQISWVDEDRVLIATTFGDGISNEGGLPASIRLWVRGSQLHEAKVLFEIERSDALLGIEIVNILGQEGFLAHKEREYLMPEYFFVEYSGKQRDLPLPIGSSIMTIVDDRIVLKLAREWHYDDEISFMPGSLVSIDAHQLITNAEISNATLVYEPGQDESVQSVFVANDELHVEMLRAYRSVILRLSASEDDRLLPLPADSYITFDGMGQNTLLFLIQSPLMAPRLVEFNPKTRLLKTLLEHTPDFDSDGLVMRLLTAKSADGTEVEYTVIHHHDLVSSGFNPTLIYGYGGFNVPVTPRYEPLIGKLWLERGGVYVLAHLRGGGERGPAWHQSVLGNNRQRAYDDMIAIIEDLHARNISSPAHTGIMGRSNGGLMVANILLQRPDLINAAIIGGPLTDMLGYHELQPGAIWTSEFGDPRQSKHTRSLLRKISPFHQVQSDADYPAPLIITSLDDDRVHPGHARRLAAKFEQLGHNVLYYEDKQGGHYWELSGGPGPGDWRARSLARAVEYTYLDRQLRK